jgi:phage terminase small subunit
VVVVKLTEKQKRFVDYYIKLGNATEAYIKAGYSKKGANTCASQNLAKPSVKAYLDKRMSVIENNRIADAKEVLEFYSSVLRGEITEKIPILVGDGTQKLVNNTPTLRDRIKAALELDKRHQLRENKENGGNDSGRTIIVTGEEEMRRMLNATAKE